MSKRRDAEELFAIAFDQAGIGAGIIDLAGIPIRVNAAVCALLGRPSHELVGRDWGEFHHPDEMPIGQAMQTRGVPGSDTYTDERRLCDPTGPSCGVRSMGFLSGTRRANLSTT
jgi:PAS domain S-box-containing protein